MFLVLCKGEAAAHTFPIGSGQLGGCWWRSAWENDGTGNAVVVTWERAANQWHQELARELLSPCAPAALEPVFLVA